MIISNLKHLLEEIIKTKRKYKDDRVFVLLEVNAQAYLAGLAGFDPTFEKLLQMVGSNIVIAYAKWCQIMKRLMENETRSGESITSSA